jgi:PIN domain nuclease of toxin-antitoxin system
LSAGRPVLLYTCAAIWLVNGDPMSADSRASIAAAQHGNLGVYVSPMTAWEIATLVAKNRLQLAPSPEAWFDAQVGLAGVCGWPRCPPNRIIAATSRAFRYPVVTRDGELMGYARAGYIEAIGC